VNWSEQFALILPFLPVLGAGFVAFYWKLRTHQATDKADALKNMAEYATTLEERMRSMRDEHRDEIGSLREEFNLRESKLMQRVAVLEAEIGSYNERLLKEITLRTSAEKAVEYYQRDIARLSNENLVLKTEIKELTRG
jgi:hypothetical protein